LSFSTTGTNILKSGTRDKAEGKMHQAKGKIKEFMGNGINNFDMEAEGKKEHLRGIVQEKVGIVKGVVGK
jgi:uncharacterized protein YjbJ (UPF0337 family)